MTSHQGNYTLALLLLCLLAASGLMAQEAFTAGPAGTKVSFESDKKIFPCKWRNKRVGPAAWPVEPAEAPRLERVIGKALGKYPAKTLQRNLRKVYLVGRLRFFGLEYGGTYYKRKVYVTDNGVEHGYTDNYIEGTFHHEFSSVLLKRHGRKFDKAAWLAANPPGFAYGGGGVEALKTENTSLKLDTCLFASGFLNEYSLASIEEDVNCYAEFLFLSDAGFWAAWEGNEAVRRKTTILIGFYGSLDPAFSLQYFRNILSH
jgi:hypothetical protein